METKMRITRHELTHQLLEKMRTFFGSGNVLEITVNSPERPNHVKRGDKEEYSPSMDKAIEDLDSFNGILTLSERDIESLEANQFDVE